MPAGIEATAHNGNVTLTGTVRYGSQRTAAELAVGGLTGVRNVKDEIDIDYDAANPVDVTALVQDALNRNALILDDSDVLVESKWGRLGCYVHRADQSGYLDTTCDYYRSPRTGHLLHQEVARKVRLGGHLHVLVLRENRCADEQKQGREPGHNARNITHLHGGFAR